MYKFIFWLQLKLKLSWLMYLFSYFVIKYQFKTYYNLIKYHYSVTMTNGTRFDKKKVKSTYILFRQKETPYGNGTQNNCMWSEGGV